MDWGLITITRTGSFFCRQRITFAPSIYILATIINLFFRFSWACNRFKFFRDLHTAHLVLLMELAEVFRRGMWNYIRIEWEVITKSAINNTDEGLDKTLMKSPKTLSSNTLQMLAP